MPKEHIEKIRWYLGEIHKHNDLRNSIAHSIWVKGKRSGSIKPFHIKVRGGQLKLMGAAISTHEIDYTSAELKKIAHELAVTIDKFGEFLIQAGYAPLMKTTRRLARLYRAPKARRGKGSPSGQAKPPKPNAPPKS